MTIQGTLFTQVEFDFAGKDTVQSREEYLEEIANVLESEYAAEINCRPTSYYYSMPSSINCYSISEHDLKMFDIKIQSLKFIKSQKNDGIIST